MDLNSEGLVNDAADDYDDDDDVEKVVQLTFK